MHRPLEQQRQHRQRERIGGVSEQGHLGEKFETATYILVRIYVSAQSATKFFDGDRAFGLTVTVSVY
jgi:hypothetical protein